ncbi:hypothetical protein ACFLQS_00195 [Actinomycetota bacterium]
MVDPCFQGFEKTDRDEVEGVCVSAATGGRRKNKSPHPDQKILPISRVILIEAIV